MLNCGELVSVQTLPAVDGKHPRGIILRRQRVEQTNEIFYVVIVKNRSVRCRREDVELIETKFKYGEKVKLHPDKTIYSQDEAYTCHYIHHYAPPGGRIGTIRKIFDDQRYEIVFKIDGFTRRLVFPERLIVPAQQVKNEIYFIEE